LQNKQAGDLYEQEFCLRCLKNNLYPFMPTGDFLPLDLVVVNGAGRCFRVQVKGTGVKDRETRAAASTAYRYKFCLPKVATYATAFDVLVCYMAPEDLFYCIPSAEVDGISTLSLRPHIEGESRWAPYKNNWSIFKTV